VKFPVEPEIGVWRVNQPQKIEETTEKLIGDGKMNKLAILRAARTSAEANGKNGRE
jgi:hypothetical protein